MLEQTAIILQEHKPSDLPINPPKKHWLIYFLILDIRNNYFPCRFPPVPEDKIPIHLINSNKFGIIRNIANSVE